LHRSIRLITAAATAACVLSAAPSAHADPHRCFRNPPRAFRPASLGAVVDVTQWTCVQKVRTMADGFGLYRAWVTTEWDHSCLGDNVRFEHYVVRVRLERNRRGRDRRSRGGPAA
jgi:hypothetical protein